MIKRPLGLVKYKTLYEFSSEKDLVMYQLIRSRVKSNIVNILVYLFYLHEVIFRVHLDVRLSVQKMDIQER